jgi:hypothetical protein
MRRPRIRFTVRRLMLAVLVSGLSFWLVECVWNREYTETCFVWSWPATRVSYTRTYGNWLLERMGIAEPDRRNWTPIREPQVTPQVQFPEIRLPALDPVNWSLKPAASPEMVSLPKGATQ